VYQLAEVIVSGSNRKINDKIKQNKRVITDLVMLFTLYLYKEEEIKSIRMGNHIVY